MEGRQVKLKAEHVSKRFVVGGKVFKAIEDVSFDVYDNEFVVILGPGQCGKTVLLNIIAGLEEKSGGTVQFCGESDPGGQKGVGMVFQKIALFPWLNVQNNVEFPLKLRGVPKKERSVTAQKCIDLVGLTKFEKHYPDQLSGGMKQRVGIARAYSNDDEILIMDEPFGQLDAQTRYLMEEEILKIWERSKRTVIFVTNNIEEAISLGDRIILLSKCPATVKQVYTVDLPKPRDKVSAGFLSLRKAISENSDLVI